MFQDEGLGIHIINRLLELKLDHYVDLIDGGTDGMSLLGPVEAAQQLLVIDAVDGGFKPGTIKRWERDEIPMVAQSRISPHQAGFQDVLALAKMRGRIPSQMVLIGVQPQSVAWGTQLTPTVAKTLPIVVDLVCWQIKQWIKPE